MVCFRSVLVLRGRPRSSLPRLGFGVVAGVTAVPLGSDLNHLPTFGLGNSVLQLFPLW